MQQLLKRIDGPAIRDTLLLVFILSGSAIATIQLWGTWWVVIPYFAYATFYGTSSDSRWHECGHGTAFKTDWMNTLVYEIASFMVMRESVVWRWSHIRHHSDTIIVGRDPEIQVPRPPDLKALLLSLFNIGVYKSFFPSLIYHAFGKIRDSEKNFIPDSEIPKICRIARIYLGIYVFIIALAILTQSWIPIFLFILPQFFGTWLMIVHNTTQHAGLAENVLDHRLNCRTVYMNPISRFIYWNMNYHLEHHMFPLVPYHALPKLHELVRHDCPPPYRSIYSAWREIIPALLKQVKDPTYYVKRKLPEPNQKFSEGFYSSKSKPENGWIKVCDADILIKEEVIRFDHIKKSFAVYRDKQNKIYATDGYCTHGNTHLSDGLIVGKTIECPKHNGRFNLSDGSPARSPVCIGLKTYPVEERREEIWLNMSDANEIEVKTYRFNVISNNNVSTFIKELVLEPQFDDHFSFTPGDYLQINIPKYDQIKFSNFNIPKPYLAVWKRHQLFELEVSNPNNGIKNNYSIASHDVVGDQLKFNVRIALPPIGQDCPPGIGSSYLFNLRIGDSLTASGPYGDFHIKPTQKEMVYIGGGAGMAPIRAHISHLLESQHSVRKISFWYGARSRQEIFYEDYFKALEKQHSKF